MFNNFSIFRNKEDKYTLGDIDNGLATLHDFSSSGRALRNGKRTSPPTRETSIFDEIKRDNGSDKDSVSKVNSNGKVCKFLKLRYAFSYSRILFVGTAQPSSLNSILPNKSSLEVINENSVLKNSSYISPSAIKGAFGRKWGK